MAEGAIDTDGNDISCEMVKKVPKFFGKVNILVFVKLREGGSWILIDWGSLKSNKDDNIHK